MTKQPKSKRGRRREPGILIIVGVRVLTVEDAERINKLSPAQRGAALLEYIERKEAK